MSERLTPLDDGHHGERELLLRLLEGELSPDEAAEINEHLRDDPSLRHELADLLMQRTHLAQIGREFVEDATAPVAPRITPVASSSRRHRRRRIAIRVGLFATAAAVAMAATLSIVRLVQVSRDDSVAAELGERESDLLARRQVEDSDDPIGWASDPVIPEEEDEDADREVPGDGRVAVVDARPLSPVHDPIESMIAPADATEEEDVEPDIAEPKPAPSAGGGHLAYVETVVGNVEYARGGETEWRAARSGVSLAGGDRLRTTMSRARVNFYSDTWVDVNRFTEISFATNAWPTGVSVVKGEIYVETSGHDAGFFVDSPDGRAVDLGTRFGVSVGPVTGTTVLVAKGTVEVQTDIGSTAVETSHEVQMSSRRSAPGTVKTLSATQLRKRLAWTGDIPGGRARARRRVRLTEGLAGYWRFDETTGNRAIDASGRGRHGRLTRPRRVGGYVGGSLRFTDKSGYVKISLGRGTSFEGGVSIAGWLNSDRSDNGAYWVAATGDSDEPTYRVAVVKRQLAFAVCGIDAGGQVKSKRVAAKTRIERGVWYHVACTYSPADKTARIYVNGKLEDENVASSVKPKRIIEALNIGGLTGKSSTFRGRLDEFCFFDRPLSEAEVQALAAWPDSP